jgi:hypothetical protein
MNALDARRINDIYPHLWASAGCTSSQVRIAHAQPPQEVRRFVADLAGCGQLEGLLQLEGSCRLWSEALEQLLGRGQLQSLRVQEPRLT